MGTHTPGPWAVSHNVVYTTNRDDCNRFTAHVQPGHLDDDSRTSHDEIKANVDLISAAPDLLEALEKLVRNGQKQGWGDNYEADMNTAYAAIDKAKGK